MLQTITADKTVAISHSTEFMALCAQAEKLVESVEVHELVERDDDVVLIDVRDLSELQQQGYIDGAYHISKGWLEADIHRVVSNKSVPIILYCGSGKRSLLAACALQQMGYAQVRSLRGGFKSWKKSGHAISTQL